MTTTALSTAAASILASIQPAVTTAGNTLTTQFLAALKGETPTPQEISDATWAGLELAAAPFAPYLSPGATDTAELVGDANGTLRDLAAKHEIQFEAAVPSLVNNMLAELQPILLTLLTSAETAAIPLLIAAI